MSRHHDARPRALTVAILTAAFVAWALATATAPAGAQASSLERVDSLIVAGDYQAARASLEQWWSGREGARATGAEQARALMLRAQLSSDPTAAEADYLSIVLGYPLSPDAPQALLRLGQGLLAVGEPVRAAGYLQRLVADYPGRPERTLGLLWLARAQHAARQDAAACAAAREGLGDGSDPDVTAMLRAEERVVCGGAPGAEIARTGAPAPADAAPARPGDPPAAQPARTPAPRPTAGAQTAPAGRFAVQTGAYRQQESVDDAVFRLRRSGYDPRVVLVPGSTLIRVRVGRFHTAQEAATFMAQLKRNGFDAVVVGDAQQERHP
jgi:cell division septation protein DedD